MSEKFVKPIPISMCGTVSTYRPFQVILATQSGEHRKLGFEKPSLHMLRTDGIRYFNHNLIIDGFINKAKKPGFPRFDPVHLLAEN